MTTEKCEFCHKSLSVKEIAICADCKKANNRVWKGMPTMFHEQKPPLQERAGLQKKEKKPHRPEKSKKTQSSSQSKKQILVGVESIRHYLNHQEVEKK